jgi:Signal transduction histidine kinase
MPGISEKVFVIILYTVLFSVLATLVLQNFENPWLLILLSGLLISSFTLRNALLYSSQKYRNYGKLTVFIDIVIIYLIALKDTGTSSGIFYFALIGDACIAYSYLFSGIVTAACSISFIIYRLSYAQAGFSFSDVALNLLAFLSVYLVMYVSKYEIRQREKLGDVMYQLKVKTKQLENTYVKLKEASEELEDVTALRERNRITREIHDTVGHTLTTVLMEMEAGERLFKTDPELAMEKYSLAKGQVRKGLNDIRDSVRTLQSGREILEFIPSLQLLMNEFTRHGDIKIRQDIKEIPKLKQTQEKALYRALQEGLTNGIKHGKSTAFVFILKCENNNIKFLLQDNGLGTDKIIPGFGLTGMNERIRELGGFITTDSKPGEGFSINITIPVSKEA